jgi:hypothetical protein
VVSSMKGLLRLIPALIAGGVIGFLLAMAYRCAESWYDGGSPDPRCVYGWRGYVEVHMLEEPKQDRVFCRYRPELGTP